MEKQITAIVVGAGDRGNVYASVALTHPEKFKIVGVVDPDTVRREAMREKYNVPAENCFSYVEELVKRERFADAVINGTMDHLHVETSIPVLEKGYHLLLEKPFAVNETEMNKLRRVAKKYNSKVVIGHVLRYTDFYSAIKKHVDDGDIGKPIAIECCEHVNYHHMAVSFVRGKWGSPKVCYAPMILAKCCHDIDMMLWMMNATRPHSVASFGSEFQFGRSKKPEGAGTRCLLDCPYVDECIYSAKGHYLARPRWGQHVWSILEGKKEITEADKVESLKTDNPYGKCVWECERDGNVDHQCVTIEFENGATGVFSLAGGAAKSERHIHIVGTEGEIKGVFEDSSYVIRKMTPYDEHSGSEKEYRLDVSGDMTGATGGHGGGDPKLVLDFIDYLNTGKVSTSCATLEDSVISHVTVFRAEEARKKRTVVDIEG